MDVDWENMWYLSNASELKKVTSYCSSSKLLWERPVRERIWLYKALASATNQMSLHHPIMVPESSLLNALKHVLGTSWTSFVKTCDILVIRPKPRNWRLIVVIQSFGGKDLFVKDYGEMMKLRMLPLECLSTIRIWFLHPPFSMLWKEAPSSSWT